MASIDKTKLKNLTLGTEVVTGVTLPNTIVETVTTPSNDDTVTVGGTTANPTVAVKVSADANNGLIVKHSGDKGLYVDKQTLGLSSAYVFKGAIYCDEASAKFASGQEGWTYNIKDDGEIYIYGGSTGEKMSVSKGDNIAIVEEDEDSDSSTPPVKKWDKLSSTVKVDIYTGSGVVNIDSNNDITVRLKDNAGLEPVTNSSTGKDELAVKIDGSGGLDVGSGGVKIKKADNSLALGADGAKVNVKANGGLNVDSAAGGGLEVKADTATIKVNASGQVAANLKSQGGISADGNNGMQVNVGDGIVLASGNVSANPNTSNGISVGASGIAVKAGGNVNFSPVENGSGGEVVVDIDKSTTITESTTVSELIAALGGTIQAGS